LKIDEKNTKNRMKLNRN